MKYINYIDNAEFVKQTVRKMAPPLGKCCADVCLNGSKCIDHFLLVTLLASLHKVHPIRCFAKYQFDPAKETRHSVERTPRLLLQSTMIRFT